MNNRVRVVSFDWTGTVIDYGSFAPVQTFLAAFKEAGIEITLAEAREPMGLLKRDHIEAILKMERVQHLWEGKFNRPSNQADIDQLYQSFQVSSFSSLPNFTDPIPDVLATVGILRELELKIGSTTGYTREVMDIVEQHAEKKGYSPDFLVCADEVKEGRPFQT